MATPIDIEHSEEGWMTVREALHDRYPQLSESELHSLHSLRQNSDGLISAVCERTGASREEVEGVIRDAGSMRNRITHAAESAAERARAAMEPVSESLRSGYETVGRTFQEHPAGASGLAFVTGVAVGVFVTLAIVGSRPEPTVFDAVRNRRWH